MGATRELSRETLDEIVRRIVETVHPEKIILFGSAARGQMGPHSDVDLLVIKSNVDSLQAMADIYRNLYGVGEAVDVNVATPEDVERYGGVHALVIKPALTEGIVVYATA
ncbi:MAG: nucleotidyltransferase domain-containing protein [Armatimonadetes bacterium]|nr:nucleotidyltransferase domain-containing protein [Armatimonadota bacterium]